MASKTANPCSFTWLRCVIIVFRCAARMSLECPEYLQLSHSIFARFFHPSQNCTPDKHQIPFVCCVRLMLKSDGYISCPVGRMASHSWDLPGPIKSSQLMLEVAIYLTQACMSPVASPRSLENLSDNCFRATPFGMLR